MSFAASLPLLIAIDGNCALCHHWAVWLLNSPKKGQFKIVSQQIPAVKELFKQLGLKGNSVACFDGKTWKEGPDAMVEVLQRLNGIYKLVAKILAWTPSFIKNPVYRLVANYRHRIWKKQVQCAIPTQDSIHYWLSTDDAFVDCMQGYGFKP